MSALTLTRLAPSADVRWARWQVAADGRHVALVAELHEHDALTGTFSTVAEYWIRYSGYLPFESERHYSSPREALRALADHHNARVAS